MIPRRSRFTVAVGLLMVFVLLVTSMAACKKKEPPQEPVEEPTVEEPIVFEDGPYRQPVYFVKVVGDEVYLVREVRELPYTKDRIAAAIDQLVNSKPTTPGAMNVLPKGTKVLGSTVDEGVVTVDFSKEILQGEFSGEIEELAIVSIVNTLSTVPGTFAVAFTVEGKCDETVMNWWGHVGLSEQPFSLDLSRVMEPRIWVNGPQPNELVTSPMTVRGTALVFEGTVVYRVKTIDGEVLLTDFTTATAAAPDRGTFLARVDLPEELTGKGILEVYWESPENGDPLDMVTIPINFDDPAAAGSTPDTPGTGEPTGAPATTEPPAGSTEADDPDALTEPSPEKPEDLDLVDIE